jgi:hypothetical protein
MTRTTKLLVLSLAVFAAFAGAAFTGAAVAQPAAAPPAAPAAQPADPAAAAAAPADHQAAAPPAGDARSQCAAAMNADPKFAAEIAKVADERAAAQRDRDTVAAHNDAYFHIQKNERHVIIGYAAMWIIAAAFVIFLWRRQQGLVREIGQLRHDLDAAADDARRAEKRP